jgi:hypothetical protein
VKGGAMFDQKNQKVVVRFQRGKMFLNANIALNIRRLLLYTIIVSLVVILIASSISEDLRKYLMDIVIGIIQSVVIDYLKRKQ